MGAHCLHCGPSSAAYDLFSLCPSSTVKGMRTILSWPGLQCWARTSIVFMSSRNAVLNPRQPHPRHLVSISHIQWLLVSPTGVSTRDPTGLDGSPKLCLCSHSLKCCCTSK